MKVINKSHILFTIVKHHIKIHTLWITWYCKFSNVKLGRISVMPGKYDMLTEAFRLSNKRNIVKLFSRDCLTDCT